MGTLGIVLAVVVGGFLLLNIGMQFAARSRAAALQGTPVPELPGGTGKRIAASKRALVYFFSPQCGACRAITPRVRALSAKNPGVFAVDVMQDMGIASALRVMATPSTVEIADGKVVGYHIGPIPTDVMARFGA
jgi:thiol-disulfide isomerase/thioredoxin